jgi:hypothetical protein
LWHSKSFWVEHLRGHWAVIILQGLSFVSCQHPSYGL